MLKTEMFVELNGVQTDYSQLIDTAKEIWKSEGNKVKDIELIKLYFKPEENACYYVINTDTTGHFHVS